jgi:hypothetical protein
MKLPRTYTSHSLERSGVGSPSSERTSRGGISPQGCNWLKCASIVAACAGACSSGVGSVACISCLGSAYGACKDCF